MTYYNMKFHMFTIFGSQFYCNPRIIQKLAEQIEANSDRDWSNTCRIFDGAIWLGKFVEWLDNLRQERTSLQWVLCGNSTVCELEDHNV
jgi:hypothetical protein